MRVPISSPAEQVRCGQRLSTSAGSSHMESQMRLLSFGGINCILLSAFYSETILDCSECSCGCQGVEKRECSRGYWRAKVTIWNFNRVKNYTNWNLMVQHPNLESVVQVFSFKYKPVSPGIVNDTGRFWGNPFYNDVLLQAGENGLVQTEILLPKGPRMFTFKGGWTFPRQIYFNGDECAMPPRGGYPRLPERKVSDGVAVSLILFPVF